MQMFFMAPIVLIAFAYSQLAGVTLSVVLTVGNVVYTYLIIKNNDYPISVVNLLQTSDAQDTQARNFSGDVYMNSLVRFPPYLIGICAGYFLHRFKPSQLKIHWIISSVLWGLTILSIFLCLTADHSYLSGDYWAPSARAAYYSFSRIFWTLSLVWIVFAVNYDSAG